MTSVGRAVVAGMAAVNPLRAAGASDAGLQREVNEDRFHCDADRGVFIVIDGVGGQAAGGKAADVARGTAARTARPRGRGHDCRPHARRHHRSQQRDSSPCRHPRRVERHGLRADDRDCAERQGNVRPRRRHAAVQAARGPHREAHAGPFAGWRAGGCERDHRTPGDAPSSPQRGLSRRRLRTPRSGATAISSTSTTSRSNPTRPSCSAATA